MAYDLRITEAALADLADAERWLGQAGAGVVAAHKRERIEAAILALQTEPFRWPVGANRGTRERRIAGYRIVYGVVEEGEGSGRVTVLRVFGPGQIR